jgi:hypothetical protein
MVRIKESNYLRFQTGVDMIGQPVYIYHVLPSSKKGKGKRNEFGRRAF